MFIQRRIYYTYVTYSRFTLGSLYREWYESVSNATYYGATTMKFNSKIGMHRAGTSRHYCSRIKESHIFTYIMSGRLR